MKDLEDVAEDTFDLDITDEVIQAAKVIAVT